MPDVEYDNGAVTIADDFGGTVKLTLEELDIIVTKTHNILENVRTDMINQRKALQEQQEKVLTERAELLKKQQSHKL